MITVLMATYQGKRFLEMQLDSILAQTVPVRILISDDGSDDGTRELLAQYESWYPKQIRLCHRKPTGDSKLPPAAQNFFWLLSQAAQEEQNDYIMLSDQDDVWFNHKTRTLIKKMKQLEAQFGSDCPILVHSDMEVVNNRLEQIYESFFAYQHCNPARNTLAEVLVENPVTGGAVMINRALLSLVAQAPKRCCMHDWWIALAASCFGIISCVPEPLYQYRQHGANALGAKATGSVQDLAQRLEGQQQVEANYRMMMAQASAFLQQFGTRMKEPQRAVLRAFLALPLQSPVGRWRNILRNHFFKSSKLQTLAMGVTIPRMTVSEETYRAERDPGRQEDRS
ncbi:MAG: glycosyltransferase family 2 protein [Lachnospiraceae bacterium]|nr:glycosyltransferase family 2 protein [Lachnospiraceae bacterium]